jgi:hypothetical protein
MSSQRPGTESTSSIPLTISSSGASTATPTWEPKNDHKQPIHGHSLKCHIPQSTSKHKMNRDFKCSQKRKYISNPLLRTCKVLIHQAVMLPHSIWYPTTRTMWHIVLAQIEVDGQTILQFTQPWIQTSPMTFCLLLDEMHREWRSMKLQRNLHNNN